MSTAVLDTNSKGNTAAPLALTTEKLVTLYVFAATGASGDYRVGLEASPDGGTSWCDLGGGTLREPGTLTVEVAASNIRAKTVEAQGATSTVTVHILAK